MQAVSVVISCEGHHNHKWKEMWWPIKRLLNHCPYWGNVGNLDLDDEIMVKVGHRLSTYPIDYLIKSSLFRMGVFYYCLQPFIIYFYNVWYNYA